MNESLPSALESLAKYLAARDHSELELRRKLRRRFDSEVVEAAIAFAKDRNWLMAPEKLAIKVAQEFSRRKKSHRYIQGQLRSRGLPATMPDSEIEEAKMRELLHGKFGFAGDLAYEDKVRAFRFLRYRGFHDALIRKVLNERIE